ncbi:MAG: alpha/beta fold hydrolase, partial [Methanobrevibacter sp.]|nr:alpha/beta fold hydrolase [Methanobrevibacter sp.]
MVNDENMDEEKQLLEFEELLTTDFYELNEFTFVSGEKLNNLTLEYSTIGTPIQNENNEIINGILYCHGWGGDSKSIRRLHEIIGENKLFDTNKFFFISISTLGSPKSSSPSNSRLKNKFPKYTILDMVNFQKKFLADKFNINHLKGLIGNSMGGFEILSWGCEYPFDMDFLVSIVSSYKVEGHNYSLFKIMNDIIMADSEYNNGDYIS